VIGDIFVFDNVIHLHDMSQANLRADRRDAPHVRSLAVGLGNALRPLHGSSIDWATRFRPEDMYELVFERSPTDLAMAQVVPIFDWWEDWWAPVELQHEMARRYPDRVLFCGGVDPGFRGVQAALEDLERQVSELGAVSMKFYNGHVERPWRCDDEQVAYPIYERCRDLGIRVLQFHKGFPQGTENVEVVRPNDLQQAARDFPDVQFLVHHLADPYFDELVSIAARFPNVHVVLSAFICFTPIAPRMVQERLGKLLMTVGPDKLIWGSEAGLAGSPAPYLRAFMDLEIPEDLRTGYGYPQLTREDKRRILGENFARLMGIDLEAKKRELGLAEAVA
jgi:predicted TIM-barrel fold metal-dependent hydrolase